MVQVRYFPDDLRAVTSHIAGRRAVVQKSRINCNVPKSCYHVFYSYRFLRRWAPCTRHLNFPAFRGCESILGRKSTDVIFSFHVLSCCNNSLSCRIRSLSCSFHVAFMSFQCPSKGDAQTGHMGILPNACMFVIFCYHICYRFGGLCRLPSSGFMNIYMHKPVMAFVYSYRFLSQQCIRVVLRCRPILDCRARGYFISPRWAVGNSCATQHQCHSQLFSGL